MSVKLHSCPKTPISSKKLKNEDRTHVYYMLVELSIYLLLLTNKNKVCHFIIPFVIYSNNIASQQQLSNKSRFNKKTTFLTDILYFFQHLISHQNFDQKILKTTIPIIYYEISIQKM